MKITRCKWFSGLATLICSLAISTSISHQADAATGFYFNGGMKFVSNKGAAVTIETQNPYVAKDSWVSIWAMTAGPGSADYAQVGYWKVYGWSGPKYFYEYSNTDDDLWYQKTLGNASSGSHNNFSVGSDNSNMYFKINDISYGDVPLSTLGWTPDQIQLLAETHDENDQNPGSISNPVSMGSAQYKTTSDRWVSVKVDEFHDLPHMKNNIPSTGSSSWEVWDSRYK
jgi:hypothetical protein